MTNHDQFYELLGTLHRAAAAAGDMVLGAACLTGEKAGALLDAAQLRIQAGRLEEEISGKLRAMGELLYSTHTGTPTDSEVLHERLREVDRLKEELAAVYARLGREAPAALACPVCGAAVQAGDRFCRSCGEAL